MKWQAKAQAEALATLGAIPSGHRIHPKLAKKHLLQFTLATHPKYVPDPMHRLIASELMDVLKGKTKRLMIFAPPQHGKTELTSKRFPAFWFGHRPNDPIITTSYSMDRAKDNSEEARNIIDNEIYQAIFPEVKLRSESKAKELWKLQGFQGYLRAGGVNSGITGLGTMCGIIDDPYSGWADANSETVRRKTEDWYRGTFRTRIWEGGAVIIITTRWHEEDLPGWLMKTYPGEWRVVRLPAIAETQDERDEFALEHKLPLGIPDPLGREPGEALSPSRFSKNELDIIRNEITEYFFQAEYQGRPRAPEGNVFKSSWFDNRFINESDVPKDVIYVRYWDKAGTEGGGKFTAGVLVAMDTKQNFYILDVKRGQWSAQKRNKIMYETAEADRYKYDGQVEIWIEQEPASGGKESAEISVRQLSDFGARADKVHEGKGVRIKPFAAKAEQGSVYVVHSDLWTRPFMSELYNWSESAKFKDQTEATSGAINKLILNDHFQEGKESLLLKAIGWRGRPSSRY